MRTLFLIVFLVSLCLGVSAYGQTPDGMTPAEEQSCRGLDGAGFGLCNAFCEAKDCDSIDPMDWSKSCFKVLDNYEKKTGVAGPPCFCDESCDLQYDECLAGCVDAQDPQCCEIKCRNARSICKGNCCNQDVEIELNICLEECAGDPQCIEENCFFAGCIVGIQSCPIVVPGP